jgi:hypothetical protein
MLVIDDDFLNTLQTADDVVYFAVDFLYLFFKNYNLNYTLKTADDDGIHFNCFKNENQKLNIENCR